MAMICYKSYKCDKCRHCRYNEDYNGRTCFAEQDNDGDYNKELGIIEDDKRESEVHYEKH